MKKSWFFLLLCAALLMNCVPVLAADATAGFTDLDAGAWYAESVEYCVKQGLMNGVSITLFEPNGTTTRAQIVTILWREAGEPCVNYLMRFSDVPETWYTEAVRWAASEKIVEGYDALTFRPDAVITVEQMALILYRYARWQEKDLSTSQFTGFVGCSDAGEIDSYALTAMQWAFAHGMLHTENGMLQPRSEASRAMAAYLLAHYGSVADAREQSFYIWPVPGYTALSAPYAEPRTGHVHGGIDISSSGIRGAAVVAAADGTVSIAGTRAGFEAYGIYCEISHEGNRKTLYAHMQEVVVEAGQFVQQGQVIGYVGQTGNASGPHLHFECHLENERYDPMQEFD